MPHHLSFRSFSHSHDVRTSNRSFTVLVKVPIGGSSSLLAWGIYFLFYAGQQNTAGSSCEGYGCMSMVGESLLLPIHRIAWQFQRLKVRFGLNQTSQRYLATPGTFPFGVIQKHG